MHKKQKRIIFGIVILLLLILVAAVSARYIPFIRILKIGGQKEIKFVTTRHIATELPHTLFFDFELDQNSGNSWMFYKGIAHSGQYSTKAFGKNSYSYSVEKTAGEVGLENLGAISMSAWIYVFPGKNDPLGSLVFTATNNNINVTWKGITVSGSEVPRGKWFKISGMFDLSDVKFEPGYKLDFLFWNNSSTDILMDDFYIVFGGPKPRRGNATLADVSQGTPFTPKFNFPPFPFEQFRKEEINNSNSSFLIKNGKIKAGDISPYDRIFSGHYISEPSSKEDLLVINKTGSVKIFTFCNEEQAFREITPVIPPDVQSGIQSAQLLSGCFTGKGSSGLLITGPKGVVIGEFEKIRNACSGNGLTTSFKTLFRIPVSPFYSGKCQLFAADVDGNKTDEILAVGDDGSWKLFRFRQGSKEGLTLLASGGNDPLKQWNTSDHFFKITPGRFLQKYPQDLLLTVYRERSKPGYSWSLLRFDPAGLSFIPCYDEKQNHLGKTFGLDTLKPSDEFLTGSFEKDGRIKVFRYNRDWRYDLKEIRFNDSTFQVLANVDFTGYEKDFNPKYFEILRLVPANLLNSGITSLLVIGRNCGKRDPKTNECKEFTELPALPGTLEIYSLEKAGK